MRAVSIAVVAWVGVLGIGCGSSEEPKERPCEGADCDQPGGGIGGTGGTGGAGGVGSGGSGASDDTREPWSFGHDMSSVDACVDQFLDRVTATDAFDLATQVGTNVELPIGFSEVGIFREVAGQTATFSLASLDTDLVVRWPRKFDALWNEYAGEEYTISRSRDWLTLQAVDVANRGDIVMALHVGRGDIPPAQIDPPTPDRGPSMHYLPQCALPASSCDAVALQIEVRLGDDGPNLMWSGWVGGIKGWNLSQWSTFRPEGCTRGGYVSVIAGEGYFLGQ